MNAYALVMASYNWTTVPEKVVCKVANTYMWVNWLSESKAHAHTFNCDLIARTAISYRVDITKGWIWIKFSTDALLFLRDKVTQFYIYIVRVAKMLSQQFSMFKQLPATTRTHIFFGQMEYYIFVMLNSSSRDKNDLRYVYISGFSSVFLTDIKIVFQNIVLI